MYFWNFGPLNWGLWFQQLYIDAYCLSENLRNTVWFDIWYDKFVHTRQTYMKVHDVEWVFFPVIFLFSWTPNFQISTDLLCFRDVNHCLWVRQDGHEQHSQCHDQNFAAAALRFDCHAFVLLLSVSNKWWHVMAFRYKGVLRCARKTLTVSSVWNPACKWSVGSVPSISLSSNALIELLWLILIVVDPGFDPRTARPGEFQTFEEKGSWNKKSMNHCEGLQMQRLKMPWKWFALLWWL